MDATALHELLGNPVAVQLIGLSGLLALCLVANWITRRLVMRGIAKLVARTSTDWDDALQDAELFDRFAPLVPAVVAWYGVRLLPEVGDDVETLVRQVAAALVILVGARAASAFLTGANDIYSRQPENHSRPIKGYIQVVKIGIAIVATVLILATLLDRSPLIFLSGIGAMMAVVLLIFRDTILSLVASIQITGNDMVRVGDWIEMPQFGADGDVIDVALHTVKVQNWDKTITTIPTHRLISDSFKNWRYMSLSGGRRIKRSISIDMATVRFLDEEEIERLGGLSVLRGYLDEKRGEIEAYNRERNGGIGAERRRLTNLGTFRAYIRCYLEAHPQIHRGMTLIVRQLEPTPTGVPIEVYCFTNTTEWVAYEGIQSDLFDHFLSVAPEFGLRPFQNLSGRDVAELAARNAARD